MLVVDASVLAPILIDFASDGHRLRTRIRSEQLAGPDLVKIEVASVIRRHLGLGRIDRLLADRAIDDLIDFPIALFPSEKLLRRAWELRDNVTAYDACYIALAELHDCPLLTCDARLARAPGIGCSVELM